MASYVYDRIYSFDTVAHARDPRSSPAASRSAYALAWVHRQLPLLESGTSVVFRLLIFMPIVRLGEALQHEAV